MRKIFVAMALAMVLFVASFADVGRQIGSGPDVFGGYTTEHVLVRFRSGKTPRSLAGALGLTGVTSLDRLGVRWSVTSIEPVCPEGFENVALAEQLGLSRTYKFMVPQGTKVKAMIADYNANPNIEFAEVDGIGGAAFAPNDPLIANCWGLNNTGQSGGVVNADVNAFEAWDTWTGGNNITLAVVDSGVSPHPELTGKLVPGWNTNNNTSNTLDALGHGIHVAGTAGALGNNNIGIAGVSFGVLIMPMRVLSNSGNGTEAQCGAGIVWAADHGADICTMSLQFYTGSQTFRDMVDYAYGQGLLLIAATGNNVGNVVAFPARFDNCYGVGATTHTDAIAGFSNYGPQCDISAPGQDVYSIYLGNGYQTLSGTSMATPHVSGLASLLWSYDPGLANDEVFDVITLTADDKGPVGWDQRFGWGRIDAESAILKVREPLVRFTSLTVNAGSLTSGTVTDLFDSDDVKVHLANIGDRANEGIVITATGTAPLLTYNRLQVLVESSVTSGTVAQKVYLFDFVGNAWVEVDSRSITTTDGYTRVNVTNNPSRFVSPASNAVSARIAMSRGVMSTRNWSAGVDQFRAALRTD
ncbi:MAG: S8 family serine peptidase [Armatimonadota bacterium]|nr:S8 family serine peptidase [Armatimonadota bacterium]